MSAGIAYRIVSLFPICTYPNLLLMIILFCLFTAQNCSRVLCLAYFDLPRVKRCEAGQPFGINSFHLPLSSLILMKMGTRYLVGIKI